MNVFYLGMKLQTDEGVMNECFICDEKIYEPTGRWTGKMSDGIVRSCCQQHIIKIYDTTEKKWAKCSTDFDEAEKFTFYYIWDKKQKLDFPLGDADE